MKAWLYILKCADGSYYTGSTNNLPLRIAQHQAGEGSDYTRRRLPVEVVYTQEFPSEHEAFVRERQVKGWSRAKKEALIRGDFGALVELSKSRSLSSPGSSHSELGSSHPELGSSHSGLDSSHSELGSSHPELGSSHPELVEG